MRGGSAIVDRKMLRSRDGRNAREPTATVGMANETNRLVNGYRVPIDEAYEK